MQRQLVASIALVALTLLAYRAVDRQGFLPARDPETFAEPHLLEGITWQGVRHAFEDRSGIVWQPLTRVSLMLDVQLQGKGPLGFHRTNLLLHVLNVLLLYFLLLRVTSRPWPSFWSAAFFACHPINVEAVAWISVRGVLLGAFFALITLHFYVVYRRTGNRIRYLLATATFAATLLSCAWYWPLPMVMLVLDFWPLERPVTTTAWRFLLDKAPLLLLAIVFGIVSSDAVGAVAVNQIPRLPFTSRVTRALSVCTTYICRFAWPIGLTPFSPETSKNLGRTLESGLFVLVVSWLAVRDARRFPFFAAGWCWLLLCMLPALGLFGSYGDLFADRYVYFAFIGLYVALSWAACEIYALGPDARRLTLGLSGGICLVILTTLTHWQYVRWSSGISLFSHALELNEANSKAHQYLGLSLLRTGIKEDREKGLLHLLEARNQNPGDVQIRNDLALALIDSGRLDEAREELMAAFAANPNVAMTYLNLGRLERLRGEFDAARTHLQTALKLDEDLVAARLELGICLAELQRFPEAAEQYQIALTERDDFVVREQFGRVLLRARDFDGALQQFQIAGNMHPDSAELRCDIGQVHALRGNYQEAEAAYNSALTKNPQLPDAHRNLALLLAVTGRLKEANYHFEAAQQLSPIDSEMAQRFSELVVTQLDAAIAMYRQSVKLHPRDAAAHGNLARHLAARRQNSEAIKHLRIALELKPDWLDGANNLAWMLSTLSNPELRNGPEAVKWATVVCDRTEHANVEYLDTLAAAYAETGDFTEATRIAETALQMARASGQQELARMVESRVRLYRNKQPYREESTQTDLPQSSTNRAEIR